MLYYYYYYYYYYYHYLNYEQTFYSDLITVDDMVDTAGTLCKAAEILKDAGARRVFAFASHGVFSGPAPSRIANSVLTELVVLDTIPLSPQAAVSLSMLI